MTPADQSGAPHAKFQDGATKLLTYKAHFWPISLHSSVAKVVKRSSVKRVSARGERVRSRAMAKLAKSTKTSFKFLGNAVLHAHLHSIVLLQVAWQRLEATRACGTCSHAPSGTFHRRQLLLPGTLSLYSMQLSHVYLGSTSHLTGMRAYCIPVPSQGTPDGDILSLPAGAACPGRPPLPCTSAARDKNSSFHTATSGATLTSQ